MGTAAASAGAAGPSEGLRAGRSSGRTKPEYTAARRYHATFGSGPMRQSDDRDSEPDYLLRPTRHGPDGICNDHFLSGTMRPRDLQKRADASVRRAGLGARLLAPPDEARTGWYIADYSAFRFRAQVSEVTSICSDLRDSKEEASTSSSSQRDVTFESAKKELAAFAACPFRYGVYSCSLATERTPRGHFAGSVESQQL